MVVTQNVSCDQCGADVTQGNGRMWRLMVMSEVIAMRPGTTQREDAGQILPSQHFCDESCVAAWATEQAAVKKAKHDAAEEAQRKLNEIHQ